MSDRRFDDIPEDLRPAARRIAEALAADVPELVARRHERLLVERTGTLGSRRPRRSTRRLLLSLAAAAVMLMATTAVAAASNGAAPGDALYGIDRALERLELALARSPRTQAHTHLAHAAERIKEIRTVGGDRLVSVVEDAIASHEAALDAADEAAAADANEIRAHVLDRIEQHVDRLLAVRERLEASGHASPSALAALERAAENARTAREHAGPKADRGTPGGDGAEEAPPAQPGRAPSRPAPDPPAEHPAPVPGVSGQGQPGAGGSTEDATEGRERGETGPPAGDDSTPAGNQPDEQPGKRPDWKFGN